MRGQLILIEGLDRSGKSTQVDLLTNAFNNHNLKATAIKFPDRTTPIGKLINQFLTELVNLSNEASHLLFLANRWEVQQKIIDLLQSGTFVILDRYIYSGIAYSYAKNGDLEWLYAPEIGLPKPDLTIYVNISVDEILKRLGWGDERFETVEFQKKVQKGFEVLFSKPDDDIISLDINGLSIEDISSKIWSKVESLNKNVLIDSEINTFKKSEI